MLYVKGTSKLLTPSVALWTTVTGHLYFLGRYSVPPSRSSGSSDPPLDTSGGSESYDVPPRANPVPANYDTPRSCWRTSPAPPGHRDSVDSYDVPRPLGTAPAGGNVSLLQQQQQQQPQQLTPSSSASSLTADSMSSSNRSSLALAPEYDIPRPTRGGPQLQLHQIQQQVTWTRHPWQ
jgi:enhancer-of-filamentation protein 1